MKPIQSPVITENRHSSQVPHSRRSAQTAFHLPESVELPEKNGDLRRRSGMIVKTVEIVEKRRTEEQDRHLSRDSTMRAPWAKPGAKASRRRQHDERVGRAKRAKDGRRKEPDCHET
jgi:hypothetical protein